MKDGLNIFQDRRGLSTDAHGLTQIKTDKKKIIFKNWQLGLPKT
jgi:hypothetical protein